MNKLCKIIENVTYEGDQNNINYHLIKKQKAGN